MDELNACAVAPKVLSRAEYSFQLRVNPWQHPALDQNIHHLLAILTALCNDCGGVVYLTTHSCEVQVVTKLTFELFKQRLLAQIKEATEQLVDIQEASEQLRKEEIWATIQVRETEGTVQYPKMQSTGLCKPTEFKMNLSGHIELSRSPEQKSPNNTSMATNEDTSYSDSQVDFTSCQRLDWSENKRDWENCVKMKALNANEIVTACPMWKPTQPMNVTPDRDTLQYLFDSREHMAKTLSKVETEQPGFAIVCKTWRFHVSDLDTDPATPPGHVCDILTVSETGRVNFWVIVAHTDGTSSSNQSQYLMDTGRMIKYQLLKKGSAAGLATLSINCSLFCPTSTSMSSSASLQFLESQVMENRDIYDMNINFEDLQRALAMMILCRESPLKR